MKSPGEWHDIATKRGATTQPAGSLRLYRQIQEDALKHAAALCVQNALTGNPEGWTDTVSRDCAKRIEQEIAGNSPEF